MDSELPQAPSDSVSCITIDGVHAAASSWSRDIRVWDITTGSALRMKEYPEPVLACALKDGAVYSGSTDHCLRRWDLNTDQVMDLGKHSEAISCVEYVAKHSMVVTAAWDARVLWWDVRAPTGQPAATVALPERAYAMSIRDNMMVVACANKHIEVYDLNNPGQAYKSMTSKLDYQVQSVSCFTDQTGFAIGSIEGRVGIQYLDTGDGTAKNPDKSFSFKCHRDTTSKLCYPVNAVDMHPRHNTLATCGGDGQFSFWDKDAKQRLKLFSKKPLPITCGKFNGDGTLFVYATGYDWAKGATEFDKIKMNHPVKVYVHKVNEADVRKKGTR